MTVDKAQSHIADPAAAKEYNQVRSIKCAALFFLHSGELPCHSPPPPVPSPPIPSPPPPPTTRPGLMQQAGPGPNIYNCCCRRRSCRLQGSQIRLFEDKNNWFFYRLASKFLLIYPVCSFFKFIEVSWKNQKRFPFSKQILAFFSYSFSYMATLAASLSADIVCACLCVAKLND